MATIKSKLDCVGDYELEAWITTLGSLPVERIRHADLSESYEMNMAHLFLLENGLYALVTESGCSCYESSQADIELFKSKTAAINSFEKWEKGNKRDSIY